MDWSLIHALWASKLKYGIGVHAYSFKFSISNPFEITDKCLYCHIPTYCTILPKPLEHIPRILQYCDHSSLDSECRPWVHA